MSERFDGYLSQVDEQVRWARVRPALRRELMGHLEEQRDACLAEGMDETSAEIEAVRQMGDPVLVGRQLDEVHRPRPQYAPLALATVLAVCGMLIRINVNHTSSIRSLAGAGVGLVLMAALYFFDYRKLIRYAWWLYGGVVLASLALEVYCALTGQSGIAVGGWRYSVYLTLLFPMAGALAACALRGKRWGFWLAVLAYAPLCVFASLAPSITGLLLTVICGCVTLLYGIRQDWWPVHKTVARLLVVAGGVTLGLFLSASLRRIGCYAAVPSDDGYALYSLRAALDKAILWGNGCTDIGQRDLGYLAVGDDTTFLLTKVICTLGWIPFLLLCGVLCALLVLVGLRCVKRCHSAGGLLAMMAGLTIGGHFLLNVIASCGLPLWDAHFPFVQGSLFTVIDLALLGVALSVFRQAGCPEDAQQTPARV